MGHSNPHRIKKNITTGTKPAMPENNSAASAMGTDIKTLIEAATPLGQGSLKRHLLSLPYRG